MCFVADESASVSGYVGGYSDEVHAMCFFADELPGL
jgi:hypothetical protein